VLLSHVHTFIFKSRYLFAPINVARSHYHHQGKFTDWWPPINALVQLERWMGWRIIDHFTLHINSLFWWVNIQTNKKCIFLFLLFFNTICYLRLLLKLAVSYVHYEVLISVEWPAYMCVKSNVDRNILLSSGNVWRAHIYIRIRVNKFYASLKKCRYNVEKVLLLEEISRIWTYNKGCFTSNGLIFY